MTTLLEVYRAQACECERLAEQTCDSYLKEKFLKTAQEWRNMVAYEEKQSRQASRQGP